MAPFMAQVVLAITRLTALTAANSNSGSHERQGPPYRHAKRHSMPALWFESLSVNDPEESSTPRHSAPATKSAADLAIAPTTPKQHGGSHHQHYAQQSQQQPVYPPPHYAKQPQQPQQQQQQRPKSFSLDSVTVSSGGTPTSVSVIAPPSRHHHYAMSQHHAQSRLQDPHHQFPMPHHHPQPPQGLVHHRSMPQLQNSTAVVVPTSSSYSGYATPTEPLTPLPAPTYNRGGYYSMDQPSLVPDTTTHSVSLSVGSTPPTPVSLSLNGGAMFDPKVGGFRVPPPPPPPSLTAATTTRYSGYYGSVQAQQGVNFLPLGGSKRGLFDDGLHPVLIAPPGLGIVGGFGAPFGYVMGGGASKVRSGGHVLPQQYDGQYWYLGRDGLGIA